MDIDTAKLKRIAIAPVIQQDLGPAKRQCGKHLYWHCPFHSDEHPSLDVDVTKNKAFCNICAFALDPVGWVMKYRQLGFVEAARELDAVESAPVAIVPDKPVVAKTEPSEEWREAAEGIVDFCQAKLWEGTEYSERVENYLNRRGLNSYTLRRWEVGYNPVGHMYKGTWINPGILLPCRMDGALWYITIRLLPDHYVKCNKCGQQVKLARGNKCPDCGAKMKYRSVPGGVPALWGADTCRGRRVVFGCEGEFDAMLTWQEANALGGVWTRTNGAGKMWRDEWSLYLMDADAIVTLFDNDQAGAEGAAKISAISNRVQAATVPGGCKDVTEYVVGGGNLYDWLNLCRHGALMQSFGDASAHTAYMQAALSQCKLPPELMADFKTDLLEFGETA